jgi:hypothetical protein
MRRVVAISASKSGNSTSNGVSVPVLFLVAAEDFTAEVFFDADFLEADFFDLGFLDEDFAEDDFAMV